VSICILCKVILLVAMLIIHHSSTKGYMCLLMLFTEVNRVGNRKWKWHIHTAKFVHTVYVNVIYFISLTKLKL